MANTTPLEEPQKRFYGISDIQKIFNIGRSKATALMNTEGFPVIKLGKLYRVDSVALDEWIKNNRGKTINLNERKDEDFYDEF